MEEPSGLGYECTFGAECIRRDESARAAGGQDGFVSLACKDRQCSCRLERLIGSGPATDTYEESFELAEGCGDSKVARRLLEEICMRGMPPALNSKTK